MERQPSHPIEARESQPNPLLEAPYVTALRSEMKDKIPGHERSIDIMLDEISRQAIDSFEIVHSTVFPGVSYSLITLTITPELIKKINGDTSPTPKSDGTEDIWDGQSATGVGNIGNAFSVLDMGIDRFVREMPKVARALKEAGENPETKRKIPKIKIKLRGSPFAFAGTSTNDFVDAVKQDGYDAHGRLYAEDINRIAPKDLTNLRRLVVNGPSRGGGSANATIPHLNPEIKKHTQGLFDVPLGFHERTRANKIGKGLNMLMIVPELIGRMGLDRTTKVLAKTEAKFYKELARIKGLPPSALKSIRRQIFGRDGGFWPEMNALASGNPPAVYIEGEGGKGYYRKPLLDPVNIDAEGIDFYQDKKRIDELKQYLADKAREERIKVESAKASTKGQAVEVEDRPESRRKMYVRSKNGNLVFSTSRRAHNFPWKQSFPRWQTIIEYCEKSAPNSL